METIKINNTTLEFNKIIYVDASNGSDETGDGSKNNPYKTLEKGHKNVDDGDVVILNGIFNLGTRFTFKTGVDYIGSCEKTIFKGSRWNGSNNNLYRLIFDGGGFNEGYTFIGANFNLYNIVYMNQYSEDNIREMFNNYSGIISNCSFISGNWNELSCSTFSAKGENNVLGVNNNWSKVFSLYNVSFDENYNIISEGWQHTGTGLNPDGTQANMGVYGGEFAWGKWLPTKYLIQDNDKIKKATMEGLEVVKEGIPNVDDFEAYGTEDLADIIGNLNKEVDMIYKRDLNDKKMYGYKLIGFKDIDVLAIK